MNEQELKKGKQKYQEQLSKKNHLESLKVEKELLESDSKVQRYLELLHLISENTQEYTECEMGLNAFSDIALNTKKDNKIYVCIGRYLFNVKNGKVTNESGGHPCDLIQYRNIETLENIYISPSKQKEFEKNNKIVFLDMNIYYGGSSYNKYERKFNQIRGIYFSYLANHTQEESTQMILNKIYK